MMLHLHNLSIEIEGKPIIQDISMKFEPGKNYCILGKNGSGKSSLALTLLGHPKYQVTGGEVTIDGKSIKDLSPEERSKEGIFLAFQTIPEIKGVKLFEFLRTIYNAHHDKNESFISFKKIIEPLMAEIGLDREFLRRDLNVGFSGGERRKTELIQLRLLKPKYIFLDEVDSGLDIDAFKKVLEYLSSLNSAENSFVIITHYFTILEHLPIDRVYVLEQGKIVKEGGYELAQHISKHGFNTI